VILSSNGKAAYFFVDPIEESKGSAGVRGTKCFHDGEHFWEVTLLEPASGTSLMVGIGTRKAILHLSDYKYMDLIGMDENSWGLTYKGNLWHAASCQKSYCEPFYEAGTVIGVHLNLYTGTLAFYRNGKNLGVAFTGLNQVTEPLYPMISSTAAITEMQLGVTSCRYLTLQEKCFITVTKALKRKADVDSLPLPVSVKRHLCDLRQT